MASTALASLNGASSSTAANSSGTNNDNNNGHVPVVDCEEKMDEDEEGMGRNGHFSVSSSVLP